MPPLLVIAAAGAGAYFAYRAVRRLAASPVANEANDRSAQHKTSSEPRNLGHFSAIPQPANTVRNEKARPRTHDLLIACPMTANGHPPASQRAAIELASPSKPPSVQGVRNRANRGRRRAL